MTNYTSLIGENLAMTKQEMEAEIARLKNATVLLGDCLCEIRDNARNCIRQRDYHVNSVWLVEKITVALTKADI